MWSQCACESRMLASPRPWPNAPSISDMPRFRAPVPQSSTSRPPPARSETQEVFPPYRTVDGPGAGIDPRTPQKEISIRSPSTFADLADLEVEPLERRRHLEPARVLGGQRPCLAQDPVDLRVAALGRVMEQHQL